MNILNALTRLRDDIKTWVTNNLNVLNTKINNKVDREEGRGLSTNDFTNEYKNKLDDLDDIVVEETDPTVPAWAKEATKPTYTASEITGLDEYIAGEIQDTNTDTQYRFAVEDGALSVYKTVYTLGVAGAETKVGAYDFVTPDELTEIEAGVGLKVSEKKDNKQTIDIDEEVIFILNANF